MHALSCGCKIVASDTAPVPEMIRKGEAGLLSDSFDVDRSAGCAIEVLDNPAEYALLGDAGRRMNESRYRIPVCLSQMQQLYSSMTNDQ